MLYAPGKEYIVYSYLLHNGKKRIEAFFPYCRYLTKEFIRLLFDATRAVLIHDLSDDSYYFKRERSHQIGRFVSCGDFLLTNFVREGEFHQEKEFEFENPHISVITQGENGWTCHVTENRYHRLDVDHDESSDSGDNAHPD